MKKPTNFLLIILSFLLIFLIIYSGIYFKNIYFKSPMLSEPFIIEETLAPVSASLEGENFISFNNGIYTLTYSSNGNILTQYEIDTTNRNIQEGLLSVKEKISEQTTGQEFYPILKAGTRYRYRDPSIINPVWPTSYISQLNPQITFSHSLSNGIIELKYLERIPIEEVIIEKRYLLEIKGKTLVLQVEALNPPSSPYGYYQDFVFVSNKIPNPTNTVLSYAEFAPITIGGPLENRYYLTNYFDYTLSNSINFPWFENFVDPLNNNHVFSYAPSYSGGVEGNYNSLSETFYITLSSNINEVMPKVNRPPAQYRNEINKRIPLELWQIYTPPVLSSQAEVPFERARTQVIDVLKSYGLEDLSVILTSWRYQTQRDTCYSSGPIGYPANPSWGGSEQMLRVSKTAQEHGYLFGLYQIYTDMYDTGLWEPENLVLERNGNWRNYGFINANCPPTITSPIGALVPQPLVIKPDKWLYYAQLEVPAIKQDYEVGTVFLDVHPKLNFPSFIDYDINPLVTARSPKAINQLVNGLLNYLRDQINGPIMGEGGSNEAYPTDTLYAGFIEGVEGEGVSRRNGVSIPLSPAETPIIPDFELSQIKPLMVRFGMGYAGRWVKKPELPANKIDILNYNWDKYLATQFAFGHSGYLNDEFLYMDSCSRYAHTPCWSSAEAWSGNPTQYELDLAKNTINLWVKQYYTSKAFQELYLSSEIVEIKYLNALELLVPLSKAIDEGTDFYNPKIYLKYEDGTQVWINRDQNLQSIWTINVEDKTYYLPTNGWLGINSQKGFLEHSSLVNSQGNPDIMGHRVDFVKSPSYMMVNGRGIQTYFNNEFSDNPINSIYLTVKKSNGWTLLEQSDGKFIVTTTNYCGDNLCNDGETCSKCSTDCGTCSNEPNGGSTGSTNRGSQRNGSGTLKTQCSDRIDNDNDERIDYPYDSGCLDKEDNTELENTFNPNINNTEFKEESPIIDKESKTNLILWFIASILILGILILLIIILHTFKLQKKDRVLSKYSQRT